MRSHNLNSRFWTPSIWNVPFPKPSYLISTLCRIVELLILKITRFMIFIEHGIAGKVRFFPFFRFSPFFQLFPFLLFTGPFSHPTEPTLETNEFKFYLEYWEAIVNNKWLRKLRSILFLWNVKEVWQKCKTHPPNLYFDDFKEYDHPHMDTGSSDDDDGYYRNQHFADFFASKIAEKNENPEKMVFTHFLEKDSLCVEKVMWDVKNFMTRRSLRRCGLI